MTAETASIACHSGARALSSEGAPRRRFVTRVLHLLRAGLLWPWSELITYHIETFTLLTSNFSQHIRDLHCCIVLDWVTGQCRCKMRRCSRQMSHALQRHARALLLYPCRWFYAAMRQNVRAAITPGPSQPQRSSSEDRRGKFHSKMRPAMTKLTLPGAPLSSVPAGSTLPRWSIEALAAS